MASKTRKPVESVELRVSIRADRATIERIKVLLPVTRVRDGSCELRVVGERPSEVASKAEEMMEMLRGVISAPKDFKNARRPVVQK